MRVLPEAARREVEVAVMATAATRDRRVMRGAGVRGEMGRAEKVGVREAMVGAPGAGEGAVAEAGRGAVAEAGREAVAEAGREAAGSQAALVDRRIRQCAQSGSPTAAARD
jgi:hypothetical protein